MVSKKTGAVLGFAIVLITVLLYLLLIDNIFKIPVGWVSLVFIIIAESVATVLFMNSKGSPRYISSSIIFLFLSITYAAISLVYLWLFPFNITNLIIVDIILIVFVSAVSTVLILFEDKSKKESDNLKAAKNNWASICSIVNNMICNVKCEAYIKQLKHLEDSMKYATDTVITINDSVIRDKLNNLYADIISKNVEDCILAFEDIENEIKKREYDIKLSK